MAKRGSQLMIPGTEPPTINEIEEAAEALSEANRAQKAAKNMADLAGSALMAAMRKHKLSVYDCDDCTVMIDTSEKVKVKTKSVVNDD